MAKKETAKGRAFRWIGPGVLRDILDGQVVVHMGRRETADGKVIDGDVVREHTVAAERLDEWVKQGMAEYVGPLESMAAAVKREEPGDEARREAGIHQQAKDQADATARLAALAELRRLTAGPLFSDEEREAAEKELGEVPAERIPEFLDGARAERERRQKAGQKPKEPQLSGTGGAGPKGEG